MIKIKRPTLSIIIPVWNEINTVEQVVRRVASLPVEKEIIVIDDYSKDGSREVLKKLQQELKLKLILHAHNKGKGAGVIAAVAHAKGIFMVVEDADSELDTNDILRMLKIMQNDPELDMVNGKRIFRNNGVNFATKIARLVSRTMIFLLFQKNVSDPLCAYKMCKLDRFKSLGIKSLRFGLEIEWLTKAIKKNWKLRELPVEYTPRGKKQGKKIRLTDGFDIIMQIIKIRFGL